MLYGGVPKRKGIIPSAQAVGVLLCLIFGMMAAMSWFGSHDLHTERTQRHIVEPGETLWSIATTLDKQHTGDMVYEIQQLNGLDSAEIYPGEVLTVPMGRE